MHKHQLVCNETDFDLSSCRSTASSRSPPTATRSPVQFASGSCSAMPHGYLIGWVVDNSDRAIKFDGLIGDAVLRGPQNIDAAGFIPPGTSTAVSAYQGITIQADTALANGAQVSTAGNELHFSGSPGEILRRDREYSTAM